MAREFFIVTKYMQFLIISHIQLKFEAIGSAGIWLQATRHVLIFMSLLNWCQLWHSRPQTAIFLKEILGMIDEFELNTELINTSNRIKEMVRFDSSSLSSITSCNFQQLLKERTVYVIYIRQLSIFDCFAVDWSTWLEASIYVFLCLWHVLNPFASVLELRWRLFSTT